MKVKMGLAALAACLASVSLAGGAAPEKDPKAAAGKPAKGGVLVDRTSRPKRVDAAACVNKGGAACLLTVQVGPKCEITVSPDALFIKEKGTTVLVWELQGKATFPEREGIKFKSEGPFEDGKRTGEQRWQVQHKNEKPGVYRYGVNVLNADGKPCTLDPVIVDDW